VNSRLPPRPHAIAVHWYSGLYTKIQPAHVQNHVVFGQNLTTADRARGTSAAQTTAVTGTLLDDKYGRALNYAFMGHWALKPPCRPLSCRVRSCGRRRGQGEGCVQYCVHGAAPRRQLQSITEYIVPLRPPFSV
jgi:hypothetical protein